MCRSDAGDFDPACYCGVGVSATSDGCSSDANKLDGWDEWWLDVHDASCIANVENVMTGRIQSAKDKGCDGVDPDNVDSVSRWQGGLDISLTISTKTRSSSVPPLKTSTITSSMMKSPVEACKLKLQVAFRYGSRTRPSDRPEECRRTARRLLGPGG